MRHNDIETFQESVMKKNCSSFFAIVVLALIIGCTFFSCNGKSLSETISSVEQTVDKAQKTMEKTVDSLQKVEQKIDAYTQQFNNLFEKFGDF